MATSECVEQERVRGVKFTLSASLRKDATCTEPMGEPNKQQARERGAKAASAV